MLNFLNGSSQVYYTISAITAALAFLGFVFKFLLKVKIKILEKREREELMQRKITKIFEEITPNHGSSIKDKINSLDQRIDKINENLVLNNKLTEKIFCRQKWMLEHEDFPIFESDSEGKCIWVNECYLKLVKRNLEFVVGNGWKNIIFSEDRDRVTKKWDSCIKDGIDSEDTYRVIDADGKIYKVFCSATKLEGTGYLGYLKILE